MQVPSFRRASGGVAIACQTPVAWPASLECEELKEWQHVAGMTASFVQ